jgi:hypothetical protein
MFLAHITTVTHSAIVIIITIGRLPFGVLCKRLAERGDQLYPINASLALKRD